MRQVLLHLDDEGITLFSDQRGVLFARSFDDPDAAGSGVDIGAFELQTLSLVVSNQADENDGNHSVGELSLREAIDVANRISRSRHDHL